MKTVLVVEDELDTAEFLKTVIELEGHTAVLSPHGEDALRRCCTVIRTTPRSCRSRSTSTC